MTAEQLAACREMENPPSEAYGSGECSLVVSYTAPLDQSTDELIENALGRLSIESGCEIRPGFSPHRTYSRAGDPPMRDLVFRCVGEERKALFKIVEELARHPKIRNIFRCEIWGGPNAIEGLEFIEGTLYRG